MPEPPGLAHRRPPKSGITYHVRSGLSTWLEAEAARAATCLAAMSAVYADLLFRKAHLTPVARASVWTLNSLGGLVDRAVPSLRAPIPGSLFLNFHVVAEKPK